MKKLSSLFISYRFQLVLLLLLLTWIICFGADSFLGLLAFFSTTIPCPNDDDGSNPPPPRPNPPAPYSQGGYSYSQGSYGDYSQGGYYSQGSYGDDGYSQASYSTPFLYVRTKNGYEMDNDVMFGKPTSNYPNLQLGIKDYLSGKIVPDSYIIKNTPEILDNKLQVSLKEIEPEVSAIDTISLKKITHSKNCMPVVVNGQNSLVLFDHTTLQQLNNTRKAELKITGGSQTKTVQFSADQELDLQRGDLVRFTISSDQLKVTGDGKRYLIISSLYRDWTMGGAYWETKNQSKQPSYRFVKLKQRISVLPSIILAGFASILGYNIAHDQSTQVNQERLAKTFGVQTASADVPNKSLLVSYWHDAEYKQIAVVQPRYYQADLDAIEVPENAFVDGKLHIQIEATQRHHLTGVALATASQEELSVQDCVINSIESSNLSIESDSTMFATPQNGHFAITQPGAEIKLTFDVGDSNPEQKDSFLFNIGGVYAPASIAEQESNHTWPNQLDKEAIAFLEKLYNYNHRV